MSATLGGLIKDYRQQKNLSQYEIAFSLGWKEPSRLSRIEQGKVSNPSRELIDKIIAVMDLKEDEKNHLLLVGNYLPTQEEIEKMRKEVDPILQNWPYPAYVLDFSWRLLAWNKAAAWVYEIDKETANYLIIKMPRSLDLVFSPQFIQNRFVKGAEKKQWHLFLLQKLVLFMSAQKSRSKEYWYVETIKELMNNKLFAILWTQAQNFHNEIQIDRYEKKSLVNVKDTSQRLSFYLFKAPLLHDQRFDIEFHVPSDIETYSYFDNSL